MDNSTLPPASADAAGASASSGSAALSAAAIAAAGVAGISALVALVRTAAQPALRSLLDPLLEELKGRILVSIAAQLRSTSLPPSTDADVVAAARTVLTAVVAAIDASVAAAPQPPATPSPSS